MGKRGRIAVFGRADAAPGGEEYGRARALGRGLAAAGFRVATGGYGGVMEAVSLGAREGGAETEGGLCTAFRTRIPNSYLDRAVWTDDLFARTRGLVEGADGFVAMEPRVGTLSEVTFVWALWKAALLPPRPMVLVGAAWEAVLAPLNQFAVMEKNLLDYLGCVPGPAEALERLGRAFPEGT